MFLSLLAMTFITAAAVSALAAYFFRPSMEKILDQIVEESLSRSWMRYLVFAILIVGVSGGVRLRELERYIIQSDPALAPPQLTTERWVLEIYGTVIGSLQSIAWMLLVFFVFSLMAYVVVRLFGQRGGAGADQSRPRQETLSGPTSTSLS